MDYQLTNTRNGLAPQLVTLFFALLISAAAPVIGASIATHPEAVPSGFIKASGAKLVNSRGEVVTLRGVSFGNNVWLKPSTAPTFHHDVRDFLRVSAMGMNAIRFYLNYQLFEDDAKPYQYRDEGFAWIDKNIAWAKAAGIVLLLNMHVPQGGFQSNGEGDAFWTKKKNQKRFTALWTEIARRYRNEPVVAGLDLLNEPRPTKNLAQWQRLAKQTVKEIRRVNPNTMIVIERALSIGSDFALGDKGNFFRVNDDNILYQFHFYSPIEYTHQKASWINLGDGGTYPDKSKINAGALRWKAWSWKNPPPALPPGDSTWQYYESAKYTIPNDIDYVLPVITSELNSGSAYFDELVVKEYQADGKFVRDIVKDGLDTDEGYQFWQAAGRGSFSMSDNCTRGRCFKISNTNHDANLQNRNLFFSPKAGHKYSVAGYMRGENVSQKSRPDPRGNWTQTSRAFFRLDYFQAHSPVQRTKAALAGEVDQLMAWGLAENVPLYLGEFGLIHHCYLEEKGGLRWVTDMLDIIIERDLHFTFHAYHETNFAIYVNDSTKSLPNAKDAVPGLKELFSEKLKH